MRSAAWRISSIVGAATGDSNYHLRIIDFAPLGVRVTAESRAEYRRVPEGPLKIAGRFIAAQAELKKSTESQRDD